MLNLIQYWHLRIDKMGPNTVESSTVEQFQRWSLNWYWHSPIPVLAPLPTCIIWSVYSMHNFFWPFDKPLIFWHKLADFWLPTLPRRNKSGFWSAIEPCIPSALKHKTIQISNYSNNERRNLPCFITFFSFCLNS